MVQNSFKFAPPFKALHFSYDIRNAWFTVLESLRAELLKEGTLRGGAQSTILSTKIKGGLRSMTLRIPL